VREESGTSGRPPKKEVALAATDVGRVVVGRGIAARAGWSGEVRERGRKGE